MIYRYRVWQTLSGNSGSFFCPFTHLKNPPKITILKKWTTKNKNARDTILHMGTKNHNHEVQFFRYGVRGTEFFVEFFCLFTPNNLENQNAEKMKKVSGDVIILHMCTKNQDHMMHASWDMECNRHNILSFWANFCPFTPLMTQKIKILKKWKKHLEISFYTCAP